MTQDSNRGALAPWGERPASPPPAAGWLGALTVPFLLGHVVVMLVTTGVLTVVNLLAGPRVWWSLAVLVIWLALVLIHAIGVGSRTLLFVDEGAAPAPVDRLRGEPVGPAVPSWFTSPRRDGAPSVTVPESWQLPEDTPGPIPPAPGPNGTTPPLPKPGEKVPWRAATDIAWLRKPSATSSGESEPPAGPASEEASS